MLKGLPIYRVSYGYAVWLCWAGPPPMGTVEWYKTAGIEGKVEDDDIYDDMTMMVVVIMVI